MRECGDCRYYMERKPEPEVNGHGYVGRCHRYPPQADIHNLPVVHRDCCGCGEFKQIPEEEQE